MTILSDLDIKRELGVNIYVYPYKAKNLKGASYNLTASKLAWNLSTKKVFMILKIIKLLSNLI